MYDPKNMCSEEERRFEVDKQDLLFRINNQCAKVQKVIAKKYHNPDDTELLGVLSELGVLLNEFLSGEN